MRRGIGKRIEEFLRLHPRALYLERRLGVVLGPFDCPRDLERENLLERKPLACSLRVRLFLRRVYPDECGGKVGKVVSLADILGYRIFHVFEHVTSENAFKGMEKPQARDAAAFRIHGEYPRSLRRFRFVGEHSLRHHASRHYLNFRIRNVRAFGTSSHRAREFDRGVLCYIRSHVRLVEPHHLDLAARIFEPSLGRVAPALPEFLCFEAGQRAEERYLCSGHETLRLCGATSGLIAGGEVPENVFDCADTKTFQRRSLYRRKAEMLRYVIAGGHGSMIHRLIHTPSFFNIACACRVRTMSGFGVTK